LEHADIAAGARVIFHVELLLQALRQLVGDEPRDQVSRAASREWRDDLDGMVWICALRKCCI